MEEHKARNRLLELFPVEIWEQILGNVKDVNDYHRIRDASPMLGSLLHTQLRTQILFPEVFKVMFNHLHGGQRTPSPELNSLLLNCRRVCRCWAEGVDNYLQDAAPRRQLSPRCLPGARQNQRNAYPANLRQFLYFFNSYEYWGDKIQLFQEHFDSTHYHTTGRNPFIGRSLCLSFGALVENPRFPWQMAELLRKYGHHVWYLHVRILDHMPLHRLDRYIGLRDIMQHLPNLKVLTIHVHTNEYNHQLACWMERILVFPEYKQLQCIKAHDLPNCVLNSLMAANWRVPQVELTGTLMRKEDARLRRRRRQGSGETEGIDAKRRR